MFFSLINIAIPPPSVLFERFKNGACTVVQRCIDAFKHVREGSIQISSISVYYKYSSTVKIKVNPGEKDRANTLLARALVGTMCMSRGSHHYVPCTSICDGDQNF